MGNAKPQATVEPPTPNDQYPTPSTEGSAAEAVTTFREVRQPIERDDEETRQLLRLSQLEGRDPLQDAVAGRLALDRLDEAADRDTDPQRARWADELRRELRERFNEIAPTKFEVTS
ncbi:MAG: hypothetical protein GXP24_02860 [Planctomycetes bacterium]|nr:hypothetical protein [Planctomycetota bacterium]